MENVFILNPSLKLLDLKNAINNRLVKVQSIITLLLAASQENEFIINDRTINIALWAAEGYLDEIECLHEKLDIITQPICQQMINV
jgi:hypothetical protein